MQDKEIWKPIEDYEGYYEVSNLGRIKSLVGWNGRKYIEREKNVKSKQRKTPKQITIERLLICTRMEIKRLSRCIDWLQKLLYRIL